MKKVAYRIISHKLTVYLFLYIVLFLIVGATLLVEPTDNDSFPFLRYIIVIFASLLLTKYFLYMFLSPWNEIRQKLKQRHLSSQLTTPYRPRVTVLVPAWNEGLGVVTTIEGLLKSDYYNLEILMVDNASTDGTEINIRKLIGEHRQAVKDGLRSKEMVVKYLYQGIQGKGHALNMGLEHATGDIILSIDADCYIPPQTVGNFVKYFIDPSVMAAVGNVRIGNTDTILGVIQYLEFLFSFYFKKAESLVNTIYIIGGAAGAFRKDVFKQLGTYSATNITEDIELSVRIQSAGMKIAYAPDALVYTEGAVTLKGLMKQRLRWKRGRFETFSEHKHLFFSTKKQHNKLLTWLILPLAILGELQLSLEICFLTFLYIFSFITSDFSSFISGIVVVGSMFMVQVVFDEHRDKLWSFILLAPIGWLLFYISTYVETYALFKSVSGHLRKSEITWQKWDRQGVFTKATDQSGIL